jgi:predicted nucleic acid-binding protein
MSDPKDRVFVDTGAWIALALTRDPLHDRARAAWERLRSSGRRILTSLPIVIETFTFLDRNTTRDVALQWKDLLPKIPHFKVLECTSRDLAEAWAFLSRPNLHKLSLVDATSFVLMARERVRIAFAYDHHFASVGFRLLD